MPPQRFLESGKRDSGCLNIDTSFPCLFLAFSARVIVEIYYCSAPECFFILLFYRLSQTDIVLLLLLPGRSPPPDPASAPNGSAAPASASVTVATATATTAAAAAADPEPAASFPPIEPLISFLFFCYITAFFLSCTARGGISIHMKFA